MICLTLYQHCQMGGQKTPWQICITNNFDLHFRRSLHECQVCITLGYLIEVVSRRIATYILRQMIP